MAHELDQILEEAKAKKLSPLYLLWGEEFLVRKGADELVKLLVPDASVGLNLAVMDGASPKEVAAELATLPLFPGRKVVVLRDPEFIAPKKGRQDGLSRAKEAWKAGRKKEGARRLLQLLARVGLGVEALSAPDADLFREELGIELEAVDREFLTEVFAFCKDERIAAPEGDVGALVELFERGLPDGHALVVAATEVDGRGPLVKLAREVGRLVERKVADKLKEIDLSELAAEVLAPFKKRLGPGAMEALKDRCGGNMRLVQSELEKLALHAEGAQITADDVRLLVRHAREEEFFELSDALQKRDLRASLKYVQDALAQERHALQLLGAIASILRGLIHGSERLAQLGPGAARMSYNEFKSRVAPKLEEEAKAHKVKPQHPYVAFLGLQAAGRYRRAELMEGLVACAEADLMLKTSANGQLVLERLLWRLLGAKAA